LVHAIEAELSTSSSLISSIYARQVIHMVYQYLPQVHQKTNNLQAREKMAYAEFMAGMAFNSASLGFVHSLSHALSGTYDTPHGLANAILLPYVLDYELRYYKATTKIAKIGNFLGIDNSNLSEMEQAKNCIQALVKFTKSLDIPMKLSDIITNISRRDIKHMATKAMKDFCGISNPVQFSRREVIRIYKNAISGKFDNILLN
jgi:alcohol dehydrogenase